MLEIIVIRHGETDWNRQRRFQGQIDVPLNALGLQQAERLALRLRDEPIDGLISSDLARARATAEAIARVHGEAGPEVVGDWREQAFGLLEGLSLDDILRRHPQVWSRWCEHDAAYAPPGGESNTQFQARIWQALQALHQRRPHARMAVVSHGGVLDMLWRSARGESLSGARRCEIPNTGINRLQFDGQRLQIVQWADAEHLQGLPPPVLVPASAGASGPVQQATGSR